MSPNSNENQIKIVIWGMGGFVHQHKEDIKKFSSKFDIVAFTDSYCNEEKSWNQYTVLPAENLNRINWDYISIFSNDEWKIRKTINELKLCNPNRIITFIELSLMYEFDMDVDDVYDRLTRSLPHDLSRSMQKRRIYRYLVNKYSYILFEEKYKELTLKKKKEIINIRPIWFFWHSGLDNAPKIVQVCHSSIERALGKNDNLFLLDMNNITEYIDIPEYILLKHEQGIIDHTRFADFIRVSLLNTYGGVWVDSTVYLLSNNPPTQLNTNDLFMYHIQEKGLEAGDPQVVASWLIVANKESVILKSLQALLYEYWHKENTVVDYFFFHLFVTMSANYYRDEWNKMDIVLRSTSNRLIRLLNRKMEQPIISEIVGMHSIQKLSLKTVLDESENSVWHYMLSCAESHMALKDYIDEDYCLGERYETNDISPRHA